MTDDGSYYRKSTISGILQQEYRIFGRIPILWGIYCIKKSNNFFAIWSMSANV